MKKIIPCKLNKSDENGYMSMFDATVCDLNCEVGSTVAARYYKGIGANRDSMVLEIEDEVEMIPCQLDKKTGAGDGFHKKDKHSLRGIGGGSCKRNNSKILQGCECRWGQSCNRTDQCICLGNASLLDPTSQANKIYCPGGVFTTLIAGTHGYAMGYVLEEI